MTEEILITQKLVQEMAPVRNQTSHKNDFGHVLVCAGSEYMTGALVLSCSSALRSGVGLVTAFSVQEALLPVKINCPCALTSAWEDDVSDTLRKADALMKKATCVAIGPGLDESDPRSKALLTEFATEARCLVIDAGALNLLAKYKEELMPLLSSRKERGLLPAVLTPHIGEMRRILKDEVSHDLCVQFARENTCLLILKNHKTTIYTPHDKWYSIQGDNSGLAKGGSGDVLAGMIASLTAQGAEPLYAAALGVYLHGLAADKLAQTKGLAGILPRDIPEALPELLKK